MLRRASAGLFLSKTIYNEQDLRFQIDLWYDVSLTVLTDIINKNLKELST